MNDTTDHTATQSDEWLRERIAAEERVQAIQAGKLALMREVIARREVLARREGERGLNRTILEGALGLPMFNAAVENAEDSLVKGVFETLHNHVLTYQTCAAIERGLRRAMRQAVALRERATTEKDIA